MIDGACEFQAEGAGHARHGYCVLRQKARPDPWPVRSGCGVLHQSVRLKLMQRLRNLRVRGLALPRAWVPHPHLPAGTREHLGPGAADQALTNDRDNADASDRADILSLIGHRSPLLRATTPCAAGQGHATALPKGRCV